MDCFFCGMLAVFVPLPAGANPRAMPEASMGATGGGGPKNEGILTPGCIAGVRRIRLSDREIQLVLSTELGGELWTSDD